MNICIIAPQIIKAVSGGLSTQVEYTSKYLAKLGVEVTFYNQWEDYNWEKFDLVHLFRADYETYNMAEFLHKSSIPFIVSPVFYNLNKKLIIRMYLMLSNVMQLVFKGLRSDFDYLFQICKFSYHLLPNTLSEAEFMHYCLGVEKKRMSVVPNGVEIRFKDADPGQFVKKYGLKDFILTVGHLGNRRKNILSLLKVLEKIEYPSVIIGKFNNSKYDLQCMDIVKRNKHILWIDLLYHNDPVLESAYAACKVFVLPSFFETPGIAALEAALAGANIVITPYGGTKEYFREMAEYVEPGCKGSIRNGIIKALSKKRNLILKKYIIDNFTWPIVAQKTLSVYKTILNI
ncbi:MAG: glycosyltransferase family 4 protein [Chitinispirillia bacterium]|jgi:glycosyltransferase involved in cell wall biosynthesis